MDESEVERIADEEFILRRIPAQPLFQGSPKKPKKITTRNFDLRPEETGVSCNAESLMSADELLARTETPPGASVARASVKDLRILGLDVIWTTMQDNPGHCEIVSNTANLTDDEIREKLTEAFKYIDRC